MAAQIDTPMGDVPADTEKDTGDNAAPALVLSDDEARVLALYDQLKTIQLEAALLRAREAHSETSTPLETAQQNLLEARASYVLRTEVVDSVLTVHPILRAVHQATQASPIERDLLAAVEQRDTVSQAVAREATARRAVEAERATLAATCGELEATNAALAAEVRRLAEEAGTHDDASAEDESPELAQLKASVKESRQRWKLIKGAASAIVVGSGVDWARDAALLDIVLDPE